MLLSNSALDLIPEDIKVVVNRGVDFRQLGKRFLGKPASPPPYTSNANGNTIERGVSTRQASHNDVAAGLQAEKAYLVVNASAEPVSPVALAEKGHLSFRQCQPGPGIPYPTTDFQLENNPVDEVRKLKVAVIGAGLSGILAGVLLPIKVPGIELTIFEKNADIGGTWLENIYPGVRCDIPAHVYQCTFAPNTQWTEEFAQGGEIRDYWQGLARTYDVYRYVNLGRRIEQIEWDDSESQWVLTIRNVQSSEVYREKADFVLPAIGRFNAWRLPDIPGIQDYQGLLRHSSNWDPTFDATSKDVAVIGNGASGVQLVPNLQKVVNRLDHYARSKTWIAGSFAGDERTFEPQCFSSGKLKSFMDPVEYLQFRKELEDKYWRRFGSIFRGSKENEGLRENFIQVMAKRLEKKPEFHDSMVPDFSPHCRRLTPGPGYLEALCAENVEFVRDPIKRFTTHGIETKDGKVRNVDAVFCATGANTDMIPPFQIISRGVDLQTAWKHDGKFGFPYTYLGLATPGFPNLLFVGGPHGNGPSGTLPYSMETQLTYYAKLLRKVSSQRIKSIAPLKKAADDFVEYSDAFFPTTVLSENCSSWANGGRPGARIHGLWPGSAAHVTFVRRDPRWEDWEYEYLSSSGNRFAYFGNGWTQKELDPSSDMTCYLRSAEDTDLRTIHESWF